MGTSTSEPNLWHSLMPHRMVNTGTTKSSKQSNNIPHTKKTCPTDKEACPWRGEGEKGGGYEGRGIGPQ